MPKKNGEVQRIIDAINDVFGDTSVDKRTTLEWMEEIGSVVDDNISAIKGDIKREED